MASSSFLHFWQSFRPPPRQRDAVGRKDGPESCMGGCGRIPSTRQRCIWRSAVVCPLTGVSEHLAHHSTTSSDHAATGSHTAACAIETRRQGLHGSAGPASGACQGRRPLPARRALIRPTPGALNTTCIVAGSIKNGRRWRHSTRKQCRGAKGILPEPTSGDIGRGEYPSPLGGAGVQAATRAWRASSNSTIRSESGCTRAYASSASVILPASLSSTTREIN